MTAAYSEVMRRFAGRKLLSKRHDLAYSFNNGWPYLEVDSPVVLARFSAEIRQAVIAKYGSAKIYCRGQDEHFHSMKPSLFRAPNEHYSINCLLKAEKDFAASLSESRLSKRFHRSELPALLQHYGVRTSWLDVVDNLYVAIWFATHSWREYKWINRPDREYGWLYFISTCSPSSSLKVVDLRDKHHHLSTRPHTQHGVSVTRDKNTWPTSALDFDDFVVATVRLQCTSPWRLAGVMASAQYLFPDASEDNTLKLLRKPETYKLLRKIEKKYGLCVGTLGNV